MIEASPYGFANAVFTGSPARFEAFYGPHAVRHLEPQPLDELASAKLPFGGVGKSGNYRPAGAWSHRNVTVPVAILENPIGAVTANPHLAALLPAYDLDGMERRHAEEEEAEAARVLIDLPRPMHVQLPKGCKLPESADLLAALRGRARPEGNKPPVSSPPVILAVYGAVIANRSRSSTARQTATVGGFPKIRWCARTRGRVR